LNEGLLYIGFSQCVFAALVIFSRKRKATHERVLIWWLLAIALKFLVLILKMYHDEYFDAEFATGLIPFTFGPFLYLYTRFLTDEDARFRLVDYKHFAPFFLFTFLFFAYFRERVSFEEDNFLRNDEYLWVRILFAVCIVTSVVVYASLTSIQIRTFLKNFRHKFSFESGKQRIYWLRFINISFIITNGIYLVAGGMNAVGYKKLVDVDLLSGTGLIFMAYAISFFGLKQKGLFRNPEDGFDILRKEFVAKTEMQTATSELKNILQENHIEASEDLEKNIADEELNDTEPATEVVKKPLVNNADMHRMLKHLLVFMDSDKPFLNPELTIQELSSRVNIQKHHLTYIINNGLHKNFFNFVNEYRVEEFKKKAANTNYDHLTLLAIAFDSGFNSKSSFNNIFKNITGQTPSEYKKGLGG